MTYEEREKTLCNNCEAKENCSYISKNLERNCSFKETTMYGWKLGYKDVIEKTVKWLVENFEVEKYNDWIDVDGRPLFNYQRFEDDFKKAMEE